MKNTSPLISFSDLTYTKQGIASFMFPLGISYVASYAKEKLDINLELFKYPGDLAAYLERRIPSVACFSNYCWNSNLSYGFAERIKKRNPNTVIVFGGPNYPLDKKEQEQFLSSHPAIDFYIQREGEKAFVELINILSKHEFKIGKVKQRSIILPNCHYLRGNEVVGGENLPRIINLDEIPSPYLSGLNDKFFDRLLIPNLQTTRGCPFTCAFCQDGNEYFNKIRRFSLDRIKKEIEYIAQRVQVPNFQIVDNNFGMYKEDIATAKAIAEIRRRYDWPKHLDMATGKNKTDNVIKCLNIIGGGISVSASVQSTDPTILQHIKRHNISLEDMVKLTKESERDGASSVGEVILGLPGDSKEAHIKSNMDLIDLDVNQIRNYQLIFLPGSELSLRENRERFRMKTQFRVFPLCFGSYSLYGNKFTSWELDEICTSNSTLSFQDYLECRAFDLTVETFYNGGIFRELINFLKLNNIPASQFIGRAHNILTKNLHKEYDSFLKETKESVWESKEDLIAFLRTPENTKRAESKEEFRVNEIYAARAQIFFKKMGFLHELVFWEARKLLGNYKRHKLYLNELHDFSLARKEDLLSDKEITRTYHFDFVELAKSNFNDNPADYFRPSGVQIEVAHTKEQKILITKDVEQYGKTREGLGRILHRTFVDGLYRKPRIVHVNGLKTS